MIYCLNDHKTGFSLSRQIMKSLPVETQVRTFFRFWHENDPNDKYLIFIRHPYEIITSGYNYHKICEETWTLNNENMLWWWIENHFTKESIERNREIIKETNFSQNIPYQEILKKLSIEEGIEYEMRTVGKLTVMGMYEYPHYDKDNVMTIRMEDLFDDYTATIKKMLDFINVDINDINNDLSKFDLNKMGKSDIDKNPHITNKNRVKYKYKDQWTPYLYEIARDIFPTDVLTKFGYVCI